MAVERPPHPSEAGGPYLTAAVLCERALQEQDGVLSLIRVIDRYSQAAVGMATPEAMPALTVTPTLVLMLRSGTARGRYTVTIRLEAPSGQLTGPEMQLPVLLEGEDRGANLVVAMQLTLDQEGLYWFDVLFGDEQRTLGRIPLRIVYQPLRTS